MKKKSNSTSLEQRILFLPDIHVPFNIELAPIWEFAHDWKPTTIILGGDVHDWTSVSRWIADQSRALDGGTIRQNYQELHDVVLSPVLKLSDHVVFLVGNHEFWLQRASEMNPNGRGFWELEKNLPKEIKIVPVNQAYHVGKHLCYMHGMYTTKYHAYQTVHACHKSVFYGHTHDQQTYVDISPVDVSQFYKGQSCGCLCNMNPGYMKNKPNKWVSGFNYCYVDNKTGHFWDTQVCIVGGEFRAEGRRYK